MKGHAPSVFEKPLAEGKSSTMASQDGIYEGPTRREEDADGV